MMEADYIKKRNELLVRIALMERYVGQQPAEKTDGGKGYYA